MGGARRAAPGLLFSWLLVCSSSLFGQADDEQLCRRSKGSTPGLGIERAVAAGDVAWEVHDYLSCAYVHIKQEFPVLGGKKLLDADAWVKDNGKSGYRVCTIDWSPGACFEDHDLDGIFEWGNGFWAPRPTALRLPYKFQWRTEDDDVSTRQELVFLGIEAERARFSLREFSSDMKLPKTFSEISFPLPSGVGEAPFRHLLLTMVRLEDGRLRMVIRQRVESAASIRTAE